MDLAGFLAAERPAFLLALQFLTRLRLGGAVDYAPEAMRRSPRWYPAVGAIIGGVAALAWFLASLVFAGPIPVIAAVAAAILLTGALHEDGFADACDGLGGERPKERILEIMRDSRIGTYGVIGLGLMLALRVSALGGMSCLVLPFALIAGHAASRASMLWVMASSSYVRAEGAGSAVAGGMDRGALQVAGISTLLALVPLVFVLPFVQLLLGLAGLCLGHVLMRRWFEPRLGGYTGDCLGAVQQASELGFLLGLLAAAG